MSNFQIPFGLTVAEILTLLISIVALATTLYANFFITKRQYKWQYRIAYLESIFPNLMREFNKLFKEYVSYVKNFNMQNIDLQYLKSIMENGRIEPLKVIDDELYDSIIKFNKFQEDLTSLLKKRDEVRQLIIDKWTNYLKNHHIQIDAKAETYFNTTFDELTFSQNLINSSWETILNSQKYDIINVKYNELLDTKHKNIGNFEVPYEADITSKLIDEVKFYLDNFIIAYNETMSKLNKLLEKDIIEKMLKIYVKPI